MALQGARKLTFKVPKRNKPLIEEEKYLTTGMSGSGSTGGATGGSVGEADMLSNETERPMSLWALQLKNNEMDTVLF